MIKDITKEIAVGKEDFWRGRPEVTGCHMVGNGDVFEAMGVRRLEL